MLYWPPAEHGVHSLGREVGERHGRQDLLAVLSQQLAGGHGRLREADARQLRRSARQSSGVGGQKGRETAEYVTTNDRIIIRARRQDIEQKTAGCETDNCRIIG